MDCRCAVEQLREPDAHLGLFSGITMGQILSLPMTAAGCLRVACDQNGKLKATGRLKQTAALAGRLCGCRPVDPEEDIITAAHRLAPPMTGATSLPLQKSADVW